MGPASEATRDLDRARVPAEDSAEMLDPDWDSTAARGLEGASVAVLVPARVSVAVPVLVPDSVAVLALVRDSVAVPVLVPDSAAVPVPVRDSVAVPVPVRDSVAVPVLVRDSVAVPVLAERDRAVPVLAERDRAVPDVAPDAGQELVRALVLAREQADRSRAERRRPQMTYRLGSCPACRAGV